MTTIKFRRDTSANWTSVNPIPAQGEPCYETDTGKLKIGNGSDNYVTLPYVSDGGGSSGDLPIATATTLGGVKVGNNLSITKDGTLTVNGSNYIKTSQVSKDGIDSGIYLNHFNRNRLTTIQPIFNTFGGALEANGFSYLDAATYSASEPADEDMVNNWTDKNGFLTGLTSSTGFISGSVMFNAGSGSVPVVFKLMEAGTISGIDQKGRSKFSKIEISTDGTTYTEYDNSASEAKYIRFTFNYNFTYETTAHFSTRIRTVVSNIAGGYAVPLSVKVDNSTIQIVDDKLHANFDGINKEIGDVSSKVTSLEGQVGDISTDLSAVNSALNEKANLTDLALKQNTLVSGTNIKTINNESLLGEGNIEVKSGGSGLEVCDIGMALYVDETKGLRRYLNGQIVDINTNTQKFLDRLKQITTLHPSLLCTEEEWQTAKTMSAFGQVGKFVFNYSGGEIVSVRIPRVVNVQGLLDLQNLGMTVGAGLPNITGVISNNGVHGDSMNYKNGCITVGDKTLPEGGVGTLTAPNVRYANVTIKASDSSSIYKDGATVQQEAIQYPYFIQIATGAETENNIINEIELNNPYSLFDSKYSDHELNNLSWLKSEGQWNAKAVYPNAYNELLKVYNGTETVEGLSVKLSTEEYTDYDFVLNTADETFRLPLLNGSEDLPTGEIINQTIPPTGNSFYAIGYNCFVTIRLEGCTHCRLWDNTQNRETWTQTGAVGYQGKTLFMPKGHQLGLYYNDGTMTQFTYQKAKGNGSLYFYVGETVQNANLIDAGRIGEQLATKTDMQQAAKASMPSNRYIDLTLGASGSSYTAPANGWFQIDKEIGIGGFAYLVLRNNTSGICNNPAVDNNSSAVLSAFVPAIKGDNIAVLYNLTGNTNLFRFIYAQGEV